MNNETIVCIAPRAWDSLWRESQQIMSRIARQNRVLYFEPGGIGNGSSLSSVWRSWPNFFRLQARALHENLILIPTPAQLPVMRRHLPRSVLRATTPRVAVLNSRILTQHVRRAMKEFDVKEPILVLYSPYHFGLVGKFGEKLACYHNYDEFPDMAPNARVKEILGQFDDRLTSQVDVVLATSRAQWERRRAINPNSYFLPNAVDFELFNRALDPDLSLPADIADVPRPIIGFAGWLGYHIDVELLNQVADAFPDHSLVLVGPDELPDTPARLRLQARPNVFFLGEKKHYELPNYLRAFDVALMPYLLDKGHVRSAYPLKLHEYLAAGRAIVAVALPELRFYSQVVRIAQTTDEFVRQVREAQYDYTLVAIQARVAVAGENTWDHRVTDIYRILQHHLSTMDLEAQHQELRVLTAA